MPIGGFRGPSGRSVRSVERALTASALLPTVAFAALGSLTVLLVAQMGMSPLGAVSGPSARDGGHAVTMPRMSISIGPQRVQHPAPARDRETTTAADARTDPTRPTTFLFARFVAHTIPSTRGRETTTPDAQPADMPAAVSGVPVVNAAVTIGEVTSAAIEPQGQAGADATDASEATHTFLAPAATAPAIEPDDQKPQTPQNKDTSVASVKTPQNTDATQASEHAKAAKSGH